MLKIKHNIIRDYKDKFIKLPLNNINMGVNDEFMFESYINKQETININNIVDGDTSVFKNNSGDTITLYFSGDTSISNLGYENNLRIYSRKSFLLLELFDIVDINGRTKLFEYYISGIPKNDFIYNLDYLEIPNKLNYNNIYGRISFYNSKNGKIYQFSHNENINSELDVLFNIDLNINNKTFILNKNEFYYIDNETYNNVLQETISNTPNNKPIYPDGDRFVVDINNVKFE